MKKRLTTIATTGVIISAFVFAPINSVFANPASNMPTDLLLAQQPSGELLENIPVTGTLENGGSFDGTFTLNSLSYNQQTQELLASGVVNGTATSSDGTTQQISQEFNSVATRLNSDTSNKSCDILFLDLAPLFLDLLGLTVDLSQVTLDVNAVQGSNNLLGNLLCTLTGLLDNGNANAINALLNQINSLL